MGGLIWGWAVKRRRADALRRCPERRGLRRRLVGGSSGRPFASPRMDTASAWKWRVERTGRRIAGGGAGLLPYSSRPPVGSQRFPLSRAPSAGAVPWRIHWGDAIPVATGAAVVVRVRGERMPRSRLKPLAPRNFTVGPESRSMKSEEMYQGRQIAIGPIGRVGGR